MTEAGHADLERALALGAAMLEAASALDWQRVSELDSERAALLRGPLAPDAASLMRLERLLAQNASLVDLVAHARVELGDALGRHAHAHRALRTYVGYAR